MKILVAAVFLVVSSYTFCQDSTFVKVFYAGSSIKVPAERTWKIEKAYITSGDGYNIQISLSNFKSNYAGEESVSFPYYIAEMELLSSGSMVSYLLYIKQRNSEE